MGKTLLAILILALVAAGLEFVLHPKAAEVAEVVEPVPAPVVPTIPVRDPYTLSARITEDGIVTLDGYLPSEEDIDRVIARAEADFEGDVVNDTLRVARGAPAGWTNAVLLNVKELEHLESGRLTMNGTDVLLVGRAATVEERALIRELAENEPAGFNQVLNIEVIGQAAENVGQLDNDALCQELLDELNNENAVQFETDSARIRPGRPLEVLGSLAGAMDQCPGFRVKVEGHASQLGGEAANMVLSRDRATAVVQYLVNEGGIDQSRLSSEGFGETRPLVPTGNEASDLEANRRIEFIVSR